MELWPNPRQLEPRTALLSGYPPGWPCELRMDSGWLVMDGSALIMNVDSYKRLRIKNVRYGRLRT